MEEGTVGLSAKERARLVELQEQLEGMPALTAFGKACHKLGIAIITAGSPQAKGRIERRHGVLQDRLVKELRLRGIMDLAGANALLAADGVSRRDQPQVRAPPRKPHGSSPPGA